MSSQHADNRTIADHNRLDALRRLAKDRAATPAEKATARRFAKALAAKIGKRPRRRRREGPGAALPEPPAARWRRRWVAWLEAVLRKMMVAGSWIHAIWIASLIGVLLMTIFGTDAVRRQASDGYFMRALGMMAVGLLMLPLGVLLTMLAWWLKTWRSERLRPALVFLMEYVPMFAMGTASIGLCVYLEDRAKWPYMLAFAAAMTFTLATVFPFYRWAYPVMKCALLQANNHALRTGTTVLAIVMLVLASGGVWAFVNPRVVPTPPEFVVPAPAVADANLA